MSEELWKVEGCGRLGLWTGRRVQMLQELCWGVERSQDASTLKELL
jgi:hypothetical protein